MNTSINPENLPINPATATLSNQSPPVGIIVMGGGRSGNINTNLLASANSQITTKPIKYLKTSADFIEKRKSL